MHVLRIAMALSLQNFVFAIFAIIPIFEANSINSEHHPHDHHHHHGLKSLHFTLFDQETVNKTAFTIVNGVAGAGLSELASPFGTLFVLNDPLTVTANSSSKVVGTSEALTITSSLDGLQGISVAKFTLNLKNHKGSISVVGVTHNLNPSDHPIVGGTGDFLFVQGYITTSPVSFSGLNVIFKIEFHVYWPPYATSAHKGNN
ncbi:Dirigent protein [Quillaja saponaria]|uniref:Dirigent protein n=1 Tax=Quillaja saponaria TaxID=32244 RepID=A0AAD7PFQ5_QUISA|nr:Dirigent protein [Quillaja saponaria]